MERRKGQLAAIRELVNSSDDEGRSDNDSKTRAKRKEAMASSESGVPFFERTDNDEDDEPVVKPSAMVRRRIIDPGEDDEG
ncbi:hypothetical protein J007_04103 [Cryptococcus neoformans]|nr:hypothetical protein J007_04103 [Cryptococcus neoformans var. grubii]OXC60325.1 hypothetical protein C358_04218 [Cryptococcus neoformans var. grubii MW-RSA852]